MLSERYLVLPGHPEYDAVLDNAHIFLMQMIRSPYYVKGEDGLIRAVKPDELIEYIEGGEYDCVINEVTGDSFYVD